MTNSRVFKQSVSRSSWVVGGVLMTASVVVGLSVQPATSVVVGGTVVGAALFSASLIVFAWGRGVSSSVTARRPLGTVLLGLLAVWSLLVSVLDSLVLPADTSGKLMFFSTSAAIVWFALALSATVQIARQSALPRSLRWLPMGAAIAVAVPWLLQQVLAGSITTEVTAVSMVLLTFDALVQNGTPVLLGTVAIALALPSSV